MRIIPLPTGSVRIRPSQAVARGHGLARQWHVLADHEWTPWLPIFAWLVDHPEGPIVVDAGESARVMEPGYLPRWHPYFRRAVEFRMSPEEEVGQRLAAVGVQPRDVHRVVFTHLHGDHVGGLASLPADRLWVHAPELEAATGWAARFVGYLPGNLPRGFAPRAFHCAPAPVGAFAHSFPLTADGRVTVVATPGHTAAHVSVLVRDEGTDYLIAGDASYSQDAMLAGSVDAVTPAPAVARATLEMIRRHSSAHPLIYLPSHDPDSPRRLANREVVVVA